MRQAWPVCLVTIAVAGTALAAGENAAASAGGALAATAFDGLAGQLWDRAAAWVQSSYTKAPIIVIGLGGLLLIPPLALAGLLIRLVTVRPRRSPALPQTEADWSDPEPVAGAFLEIESEGDISSWRQLDRRLVQIGRDEDNDICLAESTVHRYHAVIERTEDQGLMIVDISGPEGNGVRLNGEKVGRAGLSHGDVVELGSARLRFMTVRAGQTAEPVDLLPASA